MRSQRPTLIGAMLLALALAFAGCQSQPAAPAPAPTQPPKAAAAPTQPAPAAAPTQGAPAAAPTAAQAAPTSAPETLKFGIIASVTGAAVQFGNSIDKFVRMGIDDVNAKGGFKAGNKTYRLEAVTADDRGTSEGAVEAANRLVLQEKVKYVMGTITSPTSGAQTVTERNSVLLLATAATDKAVSKDFPLTLQVGNTHNIMRSSAIFQWLTKTYPNAKRIAEIQQDDATGHALADVGEANAKKLGMTVVAKEFYPTDVKDFNPLVTRVLRQNPDAIESAAGARGPFFLSLSKALKDQGFKGPVIGTSGDAKAMRDGAAFIDIFVASALADWKSPVVSEPERAVLQRFADKFGEATMEPSIFTTYVMPGLLVQAIQQVGSTDDAVKVAQALQAGQWDTIWSQKWGKAGFVGTQTVGKPAVITQPLYLSRIQNGKVETFEAVKGEMP